MDSERLFEPPFRFAGLPADGFQVFRIPDRVRRRRAILDSFHPSLRVLGEDLIERLRPAARAPLHLHLPRLDWPAGYQPFCTWLALSRATQGYQGEPQLNVGVHADHVSVRLAWDTSAPGFGRFEFLCLNSGLGDDLCALVRDHRLRVRVYASAPWPQGSRRIHDSAGDLAAAFREVERVGVWFELGERYDLPGALPYVSSPALGPRALAVFAALLPFHDRLGLE